MAVYDLTCRACGHKFTISQPGAIKAKQKRCPECRSKEVRQSFAELHAERLAGRPGLPAAQRLRLRRIARGAVAPLSTPTVGLQPTATL